jgi:hypothetical protein
MDGRTNPWPEDRGSITGAWNVVKFPDGQEYSSVLTRWDGRHVERFVWDAKTITAYRKRYRFEPDEQAQADLLHLFHQWRAQRKDYLIAVLRNAENGSDILNSLGREVEYEAEITAPIAECAFIWREPNTTISFRTYRDYEAAE